MEPIDQLSSRIRYSNPFKLLSLVLLILSVMIVLVTVLKLWFDEQNLSSPWLPKYTIYYINASLINFGIIQFGGIIPAFYLWYRKQFAVSSYCMIAFILLAQILKTSVRFYTLFF